MSLSSNFTTSVCIFLISSALCEGVCMCIFFRFSFFPHNHIMTVGIVQVMRQRPCEVVPAGDVSEQERWHRGCFVLKV